MKIDRLVINTWQIIFGSLFAVPLSFLLDTNPYINLDMNFAIGLFWQVVMTSIVSMLLWFYLLKRSNKSKQLSILNTDFWLFTSLVNT